MELSAEQQTKKTGPSTGGPSFASTAPVQFNSVEFRDGIQSLLATRVKTEEMIRFFPGWTSSAMHPLEMWGGATFDVCIRFLQDDPWDRSVPSNGI